MSDLIMQIFFKKQDILVMHIDKKNIEKAKIAIAEGAIISMEDSELFIWIADPNDKKMKMKWPDCDGVGKGIKVAMKAGLKEKGRQDRLQVLYEY